MRHAGTTLRLALAAAALAIAAPAHALPPVHAPPELDSPSSPAGPRPVSPDAPPPPVDPPGCPDPTLDAAACHAADTAAAAPFSNAVPFGFRSIDNFRPVAANPERLCWLGRYDRRSAPAVADESFSIRIFADAAGFPDLTAGPVFERTFHQLGVPGVDRLELACLAGDACPGPTPSSGGNFLYSVVVAGGLPLSAGACYWIEIANVGSASAGLNWAWCTSTRGTDTRRLQAVEGAYTPWSIRGSDLSLCLSGGLDTTPAGCTIPLPPPICGNDPANGQPYDGTSTVGARASSTGSIGLTGGPGAWDPFQRADDFIVEAPTVVTSICFRGFWVGITDAGQQVAIRAPADPAFDITYAVDAAGVPGLPIPLAEFRVGSTPGVELTWDGERDASVSHPPVALYPDTCYWVSIGRVQRQQAPGEPVAPLWHWTLTTTPHGNGHIASRPSATPDVPWTAFTCTQNCGIVNFAFVLSGGPARASPCFPATFADCNANGVSDADEIAADPALDCFNPAAAGITGGPDGVPDACQCLGDWNDDGAVTSADISVYLDTWVGSFTAANAADADVDCSGVTDGADIATFLTRWHAAVAPSSTPPCP